MLKLKLQLFAEGGETPPEGTPNAEEQNSGSEVGAKKSYTQEDLEKIANERSERASKSALKSFFAQQGLTEEEANAAFEDYKKSKSEKAEAVKNDAKAQSERADKAEQMAREAIEKANQLIIKASAQIHATSLGVKANKLDYVVKMADLKGVTVTDGAVDEVAVKSAIEKVLSDIPEFKESKDSQGFKIGADGNKEEADINDEMRKAFGLPPKKK